MHFTKPQQGTKELEEAQSKWRESEWHLSFLRCESGSRPKTLTDEELLLWKRNLD